MRSIGTPKAFRLLASLAVGTLLLWPRPSPADHSLGLACLTCHSLKSASVVPGSRNIFRDQVTASLYGWVLAPGNPPAGTTYWYCEPGQTEPVYGTNRWYWDPPAATPPALQPLDCSYCHNSPTDIPAQFEDAITGSGWPLTTGTASAHPVATSLDGRLWNQWTSQSRDRILCNDCHNSEVAPAGPCENEQIDGYPNHTRAALSNLTPATLGNNNRARVDPKYAHIRTTASYGMAVNWTAGNLGPAGAGMLCFGTSAQGCHVAGGKADNLEDVQATYDTAGGGMGGGHNVRYPMTTSGILGSRKMPCHDCHDPHATSVNRKLIIDGTWASVGRTNPYDASATFFVGTTGGGGYTGANDRAVCGGCHDGTRQIQGQAVPNIFGASNPVFPFHDGVHAGVQSSGNCLQKNGGCHQGAHNVDYFRCLDCHSGGSAMIGTNAILEPVRYVHSEFPHIVKTAGQPAFTAANYVQSAHTIPYSDAVGNDMSLPQNNGCLFCHDTRGGPLGSILKDAEASPNFYARFVPGADARRSLEHYNRFCLSCHDGSGPAFTLANSYSFNDGANGAVTYPAATLLAPKINNPQTSWDNGYYFTGGHGRGSNSKNDTPFPSGNSPARIACLECHLYHGSTAFKLLPGSRETQDGRGHVVKGGPYTPTTVGTQYSIGGVDDSGQIDYKDYTDRANNVRIRSDYRGTSINGSNYFLSRYCSDYSNSTPWSTYFDGTTIGAGDLPVCTPTYFGTSGDMLAGNTNSFGSASDTQSAPDATSTMRIGFCNVCHFYETLGGNDGTKETAGLAYTHEGYEYAAGASNPYGLDSDGRPLKSKNNFFKDCAECHDPHGSGRGTDGDVSEQNLYMIRRKVKHGLVPSSTTPTASDWSSVVFKSISGADSFDETDTDNKDDLCAVCHQSSSENSETFVKFDYRSWTGSPATARHQTGATCTARCHRHGLK